MATVEAYQIMLQKMHRRAQRAEAKLLRVERLVKSYEMPLYRQKPDVRMMRAALYMVGITKVIRK